MQCDGIYKASNYWSSTLLSLVYKRTEEGETKTQVLQAKDSGAVSDYSQVCLACMLQIVVGMCGVRSSGSTVGNQERDINSAATQTNPNNIC